jgi:hypothetical protein
MGGVARWRHSPAGGSVRAVGRGAVVAAVISLCVALGAAPAGAGDEPKEMTLESSAFTADAEIPLEFACINPEIGVNGQNVSPPLEWSKPPKGTKELALLMDDVDVFDPDNPEVRLVHWMLWRLKPKVRELAQGEIPARARQGENDGNDTVGYFGPCPFEPHRYEFRLYALKKKLKLDDGATADEFRAAIARAESKGQVLGQGELVGMFTPTG